MLVLLRMQLRNHADTQPMKRSKRWKGYVTSLSKQVSPTHMWKGRRPLSLQLDRLVFPMKDAIVHYETEIEFIPLASVKMTVISCGGVLCISWRSW